MDRMQTAKTLGALMGILLATAINIALTLAPLAVDRWLCKGAAWWLYGGYAALITVSRIAEAGKKKDESESERKA